MKPFTLIENATCLESQENKWLLRSRVREQIGRILKGLEEPLGGWII